LTVYPRLVSPDTPPSYSMMRERITTGVRGLDEMLSGGLPRGRSTFVVGPTGSGKTTLALQFALEGVRLDEETLYVSFEENPTQLDAQITALGADPAQARQGGFLECIYVSPVE
jgi:circadian clock protein KaiC